MGLFTRNNFSQASIMWISVKRVFFLSHFYFIVYFTQKLYEYKKMRSNNYAQLNVHPLSFAIRNKSIDNAANKAK